MKGNVKVVQHLNSVLTNELTAIDQYFLHAKMFDHWGLTKLAEYERKASIDEMKHADSLIERILFLEGLPNMQNLHKLLIGENVEEAFAAKLGVVSAQSPKADDAITALTDQSFAEKPTQIDKSVLGFPEPRRIRDRDHIRHIMKQACLICGRRPSDPHHLRFAQSQALGRKVSDEFTVPLCRLHHREIHRCGDEAAWWKKTGVDPTAAARALWLKTHPLPSIIGQTDSKSQDEPNLETNSP